MKKWQIVENLAGGDSPWKNVCGTWGLWILQQILYCSELYISEAKSLSGKLQI
jgi:hypothetical protein